MGKARGGGRTSKPRNPRPKRAGDPESSEEEESTYKPSQRGLGRQNDTVGMLPPSDDSEEEEEETQAAAATPAEGTTPPASAAASSSSAPAAAAATAKAPPAAAVAGAAAKPASGAVGQPRRQAVEDSDSSEEDDSDEDDDDDESSEDEARPPARRPGGPAPAAGAAGKPKEATQHYLSQPAAPRKEPVVERSPEDIRKEMERLEIIRKKRESDRLARIAAEGWDRFAPLSETNRPAGHVPADHPSKRDGA